MLQLITYCNHTISYLYQVQGVPAIFAIKDGRVVDKFVGLKEEDIIEGFVEKLTS